MTQLHGGAIFGERPGVVELRVDDIFAFQINEAEVMAEFDGCQPFAEGVRSVELRVDDKFARGSHIAPPAKPHRSQAAFENVRPIELGIDDDVAGVVHKSPAIVDDDGEQHGRGRADGQCG